MLAASAVLIFVLYKVDRMPKPEDYRLPEAAESRPQVPTTVRAREATTVGLKAA
jgi:hypothetical protein